MEYKTSYSSYVMGNDRGADELVESVLESSMNEMEDDFGEHISSDTMVVFLKSTDLVDSRGMPTKDAAAFNAHLAECEECFKIYQALLNLTEILY